MDPDGVSSRALASDYATKSVPMASSGDKAGQARRALLGSRYELATHVVVLDGDVLVGLAAI